MQITKHKESEIQAAAPRTTTAAPTAKMPAVDQALRVSLEPPRLAAIGRADNYPPVVSHDPASRASNRRVMLVVRR